MSNRMQITLWVATLLTILAFAFPNSLYSETNCELPAYQADLDNMSPLASAELIRKRFEEVVQLANLALRKGDIETAYKCSEPLPDLAIKFRKSTAIEAAYNSASIAHLTWSTGHPREGLAHLVNGLQSISAADVVDYDLLYVLATNAYLILVELKDDRAQSIGQVFLQMMECASPKPMFGNRFMSRLLLDPALAEYSQTLERNSTCPTGTTYFEILNEQHDH